MKLELKHIAPYLPYGLKAIATDINLINIVRLNEVEFILKEQSKIKLILRPLSDITEEIEHNGEKFTPHKKLNYDLNIVSNIDSLYDIDYNFYSPTVGETWRILQKIIAWNFDVFGLIDKGLAIDINTLE
jgi:hypothetical protein